MPGTATKTREALRQELRAALRDYLEKHDGTAVAADAVREVAQEHNVDRSHVAAAVWALVEDGSAEYGRDAELRLISIT